MSQGSRKAGMSCKALHFHSLSTDALTEILGKYPPEEKASRKVLEHRELIISILEERGLSREEIIKRAFKVAQQKNAYPSPATQQVTRFVFWFGLACLCIFVIIGIVGSSDFSIFVKKTIKDFPSLALWAVGLWWLFRRSSQ